MRKQEENENTREIIHLPELSAWVTAGGQEEDFFDMEESEDISHLMPELVESIQKTLVKKIEPGDDPFAKYVC